VKGFTVITTLSLFTWCGNCRCLNVDPLSGRSCPALYPAIQQPVFPLAFLLSNLPSSASNDTRLTCCNLSDTCNFQLSPALLFQRSANPRSLFCYKIIIPQDEMEHHSYSGILKRGLCRRAFKMSRTLLMLMLTSASYFLGARANTIQVSSTPVNASDPIEEAFVSYSIEFSSFPEFAGQYIS